MENVSAPKKMENVSAPVRHMTNKICGEINLIQNAVSTFYSINSLN